MSEEVRATDTAKKSILDWIGYKRDVATQLPSTPDELLAYIQKLEAEIEDLRARKDFAQMSEQEIEALAAETAVQILTTVHQREEEAKKLAEKIIQDAETQANKILQVAQKKADTLESDVAATLKTADKQATQINKTAQDTATQSIAQAEADAARIRKDAEASAKAVVDSAKDEALKLQKDLNQQIGAVRLAQESLLDLLQKSQVANDKAQKSVIAALEVLNQQTHSTLSVNSKS
jgi:cell division septum initiation protein DivIVA